VGAGGNEAGCCGCEGSEVSAFVIRGEDGMQKEGVGTEGGAVVGNGNARSFRLTGVSISRL
jgi:hypothetical protein